MFALSTRSSSDELPGLTPGDGRPEPDGEVRSHLAMARGGPLHRLARVPDRPVRYADHRTRAGALGDAPRRDRRRPGRADLGAAAAVRRGEGAGAGRVERDRERLSPGELCSRAVRAACRAERGRPSRSSSGRSGSATGSSTSGRTALPAGCAELGAGPGAPVAIYLERSLDMVVATLAVLKTGGAYIRSTRPTRRSVWPSCWRMRERRC